MRIRLVGALAVIALVALIANCKKDSTKPSDDAPTACVAVDPASGPLDTSFAFDAGCSSDDEDALADLIFRWDWNADGTYDAEFVGVATATHQFAAVGTHDVVVQVEDTAGQTDTETVSATVDPDEPPVACVETSQDTGTLSTLFSFDGTCTTDAEDDFAALHFRFDWEGDGTFDEEETGDATKTHKYTNTGVFDMVMEVEDTFGNTDRDTIVVTVELGIETVSIPAGSFTMGSPPEELGRYSWEVAHPVTLTRGFVMFDKPVTERIWDLIYGSGTSASRLPQGYVAWDDAVAFCNALSAIEGLTPAYDIHGLNGDVTWNQDADGWRLPTEAEWEYACRGGTDTAFPNGDATQTGCAPIDPNLDAMGWYCGNSDNTLHDAGEKQANPWGLFDMHGGIWEWCWDGYRSDYEVLPETDPVYDVGVGANRTCRGASWQSDARHCRSAYRGQADTDNPLAIRGFRPVRTVFE